MHNCNLLLLLRDVPGAAGSSQERQPLNLMLLCLLFHDTHPSPQIDGIEVRPATKTVIPNSKYSTTLNNMVSKYLECFGCESALGDNFAPMAAPTPKLANTWSLDYSCEVRTSVMRFSPSLAPPPSLHPFSILASPPFFPLSTSLTSPPSSLRILPDPLRRP